MACGEVDLVGWRKPSHLNVMEACVGPVGCRGSTPRLHVRCLLVSHTSPCVVCRVSVYILTVHCPLLGVGKVEGQADYILYTQSDSQTLTLYLAVLCVFSEINTMAVISGWMPASVVADRRAGTTDKEPAFVGRREYKSRVNHLPYSLHVRAYICPWIATWRNTNYFPPATDLWLWHDSAREQAAHTAVSHTKRCPFLTEPICENERRWLCSFWP